MRVRQTTSTCKAGASPCAALEQRPILPLELLEVIVVFRGAPRYLVELVAHLGVSLARLGGGLAACEEMIKNHNQNLDFCFGDHPSLADICLVPQIFSAQRFNVDLSEMPILMKIFNHCSSLEAFKDAHPKNQPDAE